MNKLYMGFRCDDGLPDVRVGKPHHNYQRAINAVKGGKRGRGKGYVKEYNTGKIVFCNFPDKGIIINPPS